MGSKSRKQRRELRDKSAASGFFTELGIGLLSIPVLALGLLLIAVFFQVAAEMSEAVWQAVIAFAVAIAISVGALMLVGWVAAAVLGPAAIGWLAMFAGQLPEEFGAGQRNGQRALANLVLFAGMAPLGVLLFRHGAQEGELNWAIEGLFLIASATVLGLGSAVPRLYFAVRAKRAKAEPVESEGVVVFVITAMLGLGLSLGISMGFGESRPGKKERTMRPAVWHSGCVRAEPLKNCRPQTSLTLVAAKEGLHGVDLRGGCATLDFSSADAVPVKEVRWFDLRRLKISVYDKEKDIRTRVLSLSARQRVSLTLTPRGAGEGCVFKVRYRTIEEPPR